MRMYANRFLTQGRKGAEKRRGLSFLLCATLRLCVSALIFSAPTAFGQSITATKAYVDRKYAEATNAVPSIVTNVVPSGWTITADNPDISLDGWYVELGYVMQLPAMIRHPRWYIRCDSWTHLKTNAFLEDDTVLESEAERAIDSNKNGFFDEGEEIITFNVRAERRESRNALGLAMAKDLEKLPTHETVTNVARSVVNSVWDASLGVAWEARMHNGHLYYIAVTNKPPEVK